MKKRLLRALSVLVAAALLLAVSAVVPASASQFQSDQTFGLISEHKDFYESHKEAVDKIANDIWNMKTTINLYEYRYSVDDVSLLLNTAIHTHPELFYVSGLYSNTRRWSNGRYYLDSIIVHWGKMIYNENGYYTGREETYTDDQVLEMRSSFRKKAQWYLDKVDDSMSDFEKALVLHDALVMNSSYLVSEEIYSLMVNGKGKCYGYSEVYSYLLAQVGVKSEIVESESMYHQWNKVEIDGKYYHVDVTWDDPGPPDVAGFVQHDFFLLSDTAIENTEYGPHTGYESDFPSTDTRYDNLSLRNINSQFCYAGDAIYVVDNGNLSGKKLAQYNSASDSYTDVYDFSREYWDAGNGYVWGNMYMALDAQDDYLYMNSENAIYAYDTLTGEMTEIAQNTSEHAFYGMCINDGKIYAALADQPYPYEYGELEYVCDVLVREEPVTEPTTEPVTEPTTEPTTEPVTEPADSYIVAGTSAELFGTVWDAYNTDNLMTANPDGTYSKTYTVDKAYNDLQLKAVKNGTEWIGDEFGYNLIFNLTGAGEFTVTYTPGEGVSLSGDIVELIVGPHTYEVYAVGNGDGNWLNGAQWDYSADVNRMNDYAADGRTETLDDIWKLTFDNVVYSGNDRQLKFSIDGRQDMTFGGTFTGYGVWTDAEFGGDAITFEADADTTSLRVWLDLSDFDYQTKTGARFAVTALADGSEWEYPSEPQPQDNYLVAGNEAEIFGTAWDANNHDNDMTYNAADGTYTKSYTVDKAYNAVQVKVVKNGMEWFGDDTGNNVTFNLTGAGTFTVTVTPDEVLDYVVSVSGDIVQFAEFEYEKVFAVGNGEGWWLNGAAWNPAYAANEMTEVAEDVWEIEFENVPDGFERQIKFALDGAWTHNFGGAYDEELGGQPQEAVYNGDNITFDTYEDSQTVKVRLDLTDFDFKTKTGAKFTITIIGRKPGDLNQDGQVTIEDVTLLQRALAEFTELTPQQLEAADVNGDGKISIRDVTAMQRIIAEYQ